MKRRESGHAYLWMLIVIMLAVTTAMGLARVGRAIGDYVRRQVSADASALSGSEVLAERLRHIGRLQDRALDELDSRDVQIKLRDAAKAAQEYEEAEIHDLLARLHEERARLYAKAAVKIAEGSPDAIRGEVRDTADGNGAKQPETGGLPQGGLPNEWFSTTSVASEFEGGDIEFVALAGGFRDRRISASLQHRTPDGDDLRARSTAWVEPPDESGWNTGVPITEDGWIGRRIASKGRP